MNFSPRKLKYLSMVPPGGNWRSLPIEIQKESMGKSWYLKGGRSAYWRKLSMDFPCPTVVTMPNHAGTSMCHPTELRALTVGEMAAVQEFPKDWSFVGSPTDKCRQIGNAVPIRLGLVAGKVVDSLLEEIEKKGLDDVSPGQSTMTHTFALTFAHEHFFGMAKFLQGATHTTEKMPIYRSPLIRSNGRTSRLSCAEHPTNRPFHHG
ncbi:MAG: DNA cytosine methyltransferase [Acidobacteriaceae bacterium]